MACYLYAKVSTDAIDTVIFHGDTPDFRICVNNSRNLRPGHRHVPVSDKHHCAAAADNFSSGCPQPSKNINHRILLHLHKCCGDPRPNTAVASVPYNASSKFMVVYSQRLSQYYSSLITNLSDMYDLFSKTKDTLVGTTMRDEAFRKEILFLLTRKFDFFKNIFGFSFYNVISASCNCWWGLNESVQDFT